MSLPDDALTQAMKGADAASEAAASGETTGGGVTLAPSHEAEAALTQQLSRPVFTTHTTSLAREFEARGAALIALVAEVDAKIALLDAEREDLMLAYSMLSHGMTARETGVRK